MKYKYLIAIKVRLQCLYVFLIISIKTPKMEDLIDQDSAFNETSNQDAEMGAASEIQSIGNDDSNLSSSGRPISKRSTRGKRRTADQEKSQSASKRGKRY